VTGADGTFELELPSFTVPTEEFDISVPLGDLHFDPFSTGDQTIPLHRAGYDTTTGTSPGDPRQHPNLVSSFLDASVVYGSYADRAGALRLNDGSGQLKTSAGNLLPLNDSTFFPGGPLENENNSQRDPATLFGAGDVRANENPALISLQTLFVREHNRRADELAVAEPLLTGEQLYQQARSWVSAVLQHITYDEFLPLLLGANALPAYSAYDGEVDPSIGALFSGAAFRYGYSMAGPDLDLLDTSGTPLANSPLSLRDAFFNPQPIKDNGIEPVLQGMAQQLVEELDSQVIDDLRDFLFGPPGSGGLDLVSVQLTATQSQSSRRPPKGSSFVSTQTLLLTPENLPASRVESDLVSGRSGVNPQTNRRWTISSPSLSGRVVFSRDSCGCSRASTAVSGQ
jgi:hypothetical protein